MKEDRIFHFVSVLIKFYMGMFYNRLRRSLKIAYIHGAYHVTTISDRVEYFLDLRIVRLTSRSFFFFYAIFAGKVFLDYMAFKQIRPFEPTFFNSLELGIVIVFVIVSAAIIERITTKKDGLVQEQILKTPVKFN